MTKVLRVIEPFFVTDLGDIFEYSADENAYVTVHNEKFYSTKEDSINSVTSSYNSEFKISPEYAKTLIEEGFLEEVPEDEQKTPFVNIFDEIDNLLAKYKGGLKSIEKDMAELPTCVKVERETVLTNMITLLEHLKSLKK